MKKRILSIILILCMTLLYIPMTVYAAEDATINSAKTNFGLTDEKVNYVYLNRQGAYKGGLNHYPHFIDTDSGIYHIHGKLDMSNKIPDMSSQYPNNIEVTAGGTVKLLFDGTMDGEEGLVWDYSRLKDVRYLTSEYSMIKLKNGSSSKPTNVEIHFAGKCTIYAPQWNAVINAYGGDCNLTVVLHDDCDVTLHAGDYAAAIGGSAEESGRNITIKTDGKYNTNGERISYKANGKLTCYGGDQSAAIGGSSWENADNITVESGIVYAYGGDGGAGIGSGVTTLIDGHTTIYKATNIKINGGEVHATGGDNASGIGAGSHGIAENISVIGGKVYAKGGAYGSGIGGGAYGSGNNISVSGGEVEATGGKGGAGIGGGYSAGAENITVSGGKTKASLTGNYNAYPIGRGYKAAKDNTTTTNDMLKISDDTKVSFTTVLRAENLEIPNTYFSCDSLDMGKTFKYYVDDSNLALNRVEINFEKCTNHSLKWEPTQHYQYCTNCQSVKAYDDTVPTMNGINDLVVYGSWVTFDTKDETSGGTKEITHKYVLGEETRSVNFNVPRVSSGIKDVTVETYTFDTAKRKHSDLADTQKLAEYQTNNGTKTYKFRGANGYDEYMGYKNAQSTVDAVASLKMQRVIITDNAGNQTTKDVYALLSHHIECYVNGKKQILDEENQKDYLDLIHGSDFQITFLKNDQPLDYQYFYFVTVNGTRIPTTEDDIYEFKNIQEDLDIQITTRFDETAPQLTVNVNGDSYKSTEKDNDKIPYKILSGAAKVTLSAEDVAKEGYPASGIDTETFEYLVSDKPLTQEELEKSNEWKEYTGEFTLPDSKVSIVYARVKDIAGNITYAAAAPYMPDESAPVISGLEEGKIYCGETRFTVSDENGIDKVEVDGTVLTPDNDGTYTLTAGIGEVTVVVTDKAGHTASVSVTVNADHIGGTATCADKATCDICGEKYGETDPTNHTSLKKVTANSATTEAEGNIEYWYCSGCGKYFSDELGLKEISKEDTVIAKLVPEEKPAETGDISDGITWLALLVVSGGICTATEYKRRKQNKREYLTHIK